MTKYRKATPEESFRIVTAAREWFENCPNKSMFSTSGKYALVAEYLANQEGLSLWEIRK